MKYYAWFLWSLLLLLIWVVLYCSLKSKEQRREMLQVSLFTGLFGLTEPLFVPEYWMPYSLFDLARTTGFDIESIIFSFAVGGISTSLYEWWFHVRHRTILAAEKRHWRHRTHLLALIAGPLAFLVAIPLFPAWNPLHWVLFGFAVGAIGAHYCRPDLWHKMLWNGVMFTGLYVVTLLLLEFFFPGYVEEVWNLDALWGIQIGFIPLEELLFAFGMGYYWTTLYDHFSWQRPEVG